jgi:uncharacterized protein
MGQPVVHFEVMAKDADATRNYYGELFGWEFETNPELNYGLVDRNTNPDGIGIAGGIGGAPEGYDGHVTFYVEVPDVEEALQKAESLGGSRMMGPDVVTEGVEIGLLQDPEGRTVGVIKAAS